MISKFWESLGSRLADRWSVTLLTPAFVFWTLGLVAIAQQLGWNFIVASFIARTEVEQIIAIVGAFIIVVASSEIVRAVTLPVLRILEGYWPAWLHWLRHLLSRIQGRVAERLEQRWQDLAQKTINPLTPEEPAIVTDAEEQPPNSPQLIEQSLQRLSVRERDEYRRLDQRLRQYPADHTYLMPTRLGNILRAAERRPVARYGLDPIICWPRLWMLLPDNARNDLAGTRHALDEAVRWIIWGLLLLVWTAYIWWAAILGIALVVWGYYSAVAAATVYGDLLETVFDLYRGSLYKSLRLPTPMMSDEISHGQRLTQYLYRGPPEVPVLFENRSDEG